MLTINEIREEFVVSLRKQDRAQATILAYGTDIKQLIKFVESRGKVTPQEISYEDLTEFLESLRGKNYTEKSISRKINSIRTFFRFLKDRKFVEQDPSTKLSHPKLETKPPHILTELEYRALRDACRGDARMNAIVELLLQTGIRIGELRQVRIEDVKFDNKGKGSLHIQPSHRRKGHDIPLNLAAQRAIKAYLKVRPKAETNILFVTRTGRAFLIRNIRASLNRYFEKAKIKKATVNDLRHTFIAYQIQKGVDVAHISKIVGHKRLTSTEKYLEYVKRPEEETRELEEL